MANAIIISRAKRMQSFKAYIYIMCDPSDTITITLNGSTYLTDTANSSGRLTATVKKKGTYTVTTGHGFSGTVSVTTKGVTYTSNVVSSYTLTSTQGTGSTLTVNRTSSTYAEASTGNLSSGAVIYYGDVLTISASASATAYNTPTITVNSTAHTSGNTYTVGNANVTVVSSATVKSYTLTKTQGTGTSLTINRNSSQYGGAATGSLNSGATIYYGDVLQFTYSANTGYGSISHSCTHNGSAVTIASGGTLTVAGAVSSSTSASVLSYKLTISATNTTITVNRTSSPKAGASTGNLSNNATIYYSDVLKITFTAATNYTLATHTVNGSNFTSGGSHTVVGNVAVVGTSNLSTKTAYINWRGSGSTIPNGYRYNSTFSLAATITNVSGAVNKEASSITSKNDYGTSNCSKARFGNATTSSAYINLWVTSKGSWYATYQIYTNSGCTTKALSTTGISNGTTFYY